MALFIHTSSSLTCLNALRYVAIHLFWNSLAGTNSFRPTLPKSSPANVIKCWAISNAWGDRGLISHLRIKARKRCHHLIVYSRLADTNESDRPPHCVEGDVGRGQIAVAKHKRVLLRTAQDPKEIKRDIRFKNSYIPFHCRFKWVVQYSYDDNSRFTLPVPPAPFLWRILTASPSSFWPGPPCPQVERGPLTATTGESRIQDRK